MDRSVVYTDFRRRCLFRIWMTAERSDYAIIRQFFADTRIPAESYRGLVAEVDGPEPDDSAHMVAAVAGQVESLVTWNVKDFDGGFTRKHSIKIVNPDQ